MPIADIKGQEVACRTLLGFLERGQYPHSLLFSGPNGSGKRTTALAFAQAVNCKAPVNGDACGTCNSCMRIAKGVDVDVLFYEPARRNYRVEETDAIRREASITPNTGRRKILILDVAEKIEVAAANMLLKVFEEPPESAVFVLLTANRHLILPTILSRAITVPFNPVAPAAAVDILAGKVKPDDVSFLYPLAGGNLGFITKLAEDKDLKKVFDDTKVLMDETLSASGPVSPALPAGKIIDIASRVDLKAADDTKSTAQRKSVIFVLEIMLVYLEEKLGVLMGAPSSGKTGGGERIIISDEHRSVCQLLETVLTAIKAVQGGGHTALVLEKFAIEYSGAAAL